MEVSKYNQMMAYLTRPKRGLVDGPGSYSGKKSKVPKNLSPNMIKFFKRPKKQQELLQKYAKSVFKKPYTELNAYEQGIVKGRAKRGFFTTKEDIRPVSTKFEREKYIKAFPEIDFDFTKHPRYGVPLKLPNGKINPEYTSAFNFRRRGYKKNLSKKSLPVSKQRDIVAKFNLPPGVKEWNFDVDRGGYLYGIPDTAGKNRNLGERIKNFTKNPVSYKVSADFSDPAGWMLLQMNRSYEDALAKGVTPEFKPIYDKINNKNRVVGFVDNKYGLGKSYFAGQKYIKKFNGTSMRDHPDYNNVKKYFNITEKARLKPNKVITDLLVKGGIGEDRLTLNSVLNYLINEQGVQPAKKAVVLHHKGGIGNPTRDLQIINALANQQVKGVENAMRRNPKNITPENIKKLKDFGVSVTIDGKTYGGGPKTALGGLRATEKFVEEKIRGFTQKDFTNLKKYLAVMSTRPQCKARFFSSGGRASFQEGTVSLDFCARDGARVINQKNINTPAEQRNFAKLLNATGGMKNAVKFLGAVGVGGDAVFLGVETLIRSGIYGDTLSEGFRKSIDYLIPGDLTRGAQVDKINRVLKDPDLGEAYRKYDVFKDNVAKLGSLEAAKAESEAILDDSPFSVTAVPGGMKDYLAQQQKLIDEQKQKVDKTFINPEQELVAQRAFDEGEDVAKATAFGTRFKKFARDLGEVRPDESGLNIDLEMLPEQDKTAEFGQFRDLMLTDKKKIASEIKNALQLGFYGNPALESSYEKANDQYKTIVGGFEKAKAAPLSELVTRGVASDEEVYGTQGASVLKKINQARTNKPELMFDSLSDEATGFFPQTNLISNQYDRGPIGTGLLPFSAAGGGIAKLAGVGSGPPPEKGPTPRGLDFLLNRGRR